MRTETFAKTFDDLRYAWRQLRRSPAFTATAVLTLMLGIGAATAIFSLVNAFLLRPLPYPHADRLVMVWEQLRVLGIRQFPAPIGDFVDYRKDNHVFDEMAAVENAHYVLTEGEFPERLFALRVTANVFAMMGLRPALGRTLADADNQPGHEHVAVLSDRLWRERFGADRAVVGRNVALDGQQYEVVGVLPRGVRFTVGAAQSPDVWVPLPMVADPERRVGHLQMVARLRGGVTLSQAQAEMNTVARQLEQQYHIQMGPHGEDPGYGLEVTGLREELVGDLQQPLLLMLGAAGLILLIACVNVANLMLTQGVSREREFTIRLSLGATRAQLIRLLIAQAALLGMLGAVAGVAMAVGASEMLVRWSPYELAKLFGAPIDLQVALFAASTTLMAMLLFGLLPAMRMARRGRPVQLQGSAHQVLGDQRGRRVRQVLVVVETALSVTLVIGAGLLIHSFLLLRAMPLGFNPDGVLTARITLPPTYAGSTQQAEFSDAVLRRVAALPDVKAAAAATTLPVSDTPQHNPFSIEGRPWQPYGANRVPQFMNAQAVSTDYFRAMQIPLRQGRLLNAGDRPGSEPVVIVNEAMVRGFWPNEDPIGKHILQGAPRSGAPWLTVVGVVGDVRSGGANADVVPEFYTPFSQTPGASLALLLRTKSGDAEAMLNEARAAVAAVDGKIPLHDVATYEEILASELGPRRYEMSLLASFGGLALLLAAVGLYGVVSYSVAQRTQEIGLRMAFGATESDVMTLVLRQALLLTCCGLGVGMAMAVALRRTLAAALFGVRFLDFPVYLGVAAILLMAALAAAYLPARRAANVEPMEALRSE